MALTTTPAPQVGAPLPDFELPILVPEKFGLLYSRKDIPLNRPCLITFICNHCPYVKAIEDRLIQLQIDLEIIQVPMIAICSNDEVTYPEDSKENLRKRALEKNYGFPYLHDPKQIAARSFGAVCTPDFFLYDSLHRLAYRGRLDDSWKDPTQVTKRELLAAAQLLSKNLPLHMEIVPSIGCSIKWSQK